MRNHTCGNLSRSIAKTEAAGKACEITNICDRIPNKHDRV